MAVLDAIHRKSKSEKENKKDFYQTPKMLMDALFDSIIVSKNETVLDPCCGDLAITRELKKHFKHVDAMDLYSNAGNMKGDFLQMRVDKKYDIIIMNPPYSQKNKFIDKALEIANQVYVLMPSNVDNYTIMNEKYFAQDFYLGSIRTYPKFFMTDSLDNIKWGGMSTYTWYVFSKDSKYQNKDKIEVRKDLRKYLDNIE